MTRYVRVESAGGIGWIVLERPERKNALTAAMWRDLRDAALQFHADAVRAVIVAGSAGAFCAGNDLRDFREQLADPASTRAMHRLMDDTLAALREIPVPTVAAIDGPCFGAGLSLATACDLRLASSQASFCAPPARLGLVYGIGELRALARLVGPARSKELVFTARVLDPAEAARIGLVEWVVEGLASDAAETMAAGMAGLSGISQRASKRLIDAVAAGMPDQPWMEELREEAARQADLSGVRTGTGRPAT